MQNGVISFNEEQKSKLQRLLDIGFTNKTLNEFKLQIYKWDVMLALEFYNQDSFCHLYCIGENHEQYGCNDALCKSQHVFSLFDLTFGTETK